MHLPYSAIANLFIVLGLIQLRHTLHCLSVEHSYRLWHKNSLETIGDYFSHPTVENFYKALVNSMSSECLTIATATENLQFSLIFIDSL